MNSPLDNSRSLTLLSIVSVASLAFLVASPAEACPYSIRDSAFIGSENLPSFQLLLITDSTDESLFDSIDTANVAWLSEANVVAEVVPTDSATVRGIRNQLPDEQLSPEGLTAVLVSPQGGARFMGTLQPEDISLDSVMRLVSATVASPLRTKLHNDLLEAWAVLLVVHDNDADAAEQLADRARQAGDRIVGTTTEMDKTVEQPPQVVVLNRQDPEEQVLLWSLGLLGEETASDEPQVAMLTGRGELRGPVLTGDEATEEAIYGMLEMLGRNCTCTTDDAWHTGPVIPLEWTDDMQASVEESLGFDPEDPEAIGAITGVMAGLAGSLGYQEAALEYEETMVAPDSLTAVPEKDIDAEVISEEAPIPLPSEEAASESEAVEPAESSSETNRVSASPSSSSGFQFNSMGAILIGGVLGVLLAATVIMLLNSSRS